MANELLARHMARAREADQDTDAAAQQQAAPVQQQQQQQQPLSPPAPEAAGGAALSGQSPDVSKAVQGSPQAQPGAAAGVRPLTGLLGGGGVVVTPHYAEGSVHRQQQLLRLIPPLKRVNSSLELSPEEVAGFKASRTKDLNPSWHGVPSGQGFRGLSSPGSNPAVGSPGGVLPGSSRGPAAAAAAVPGGRLEGTWHGPGALSIRQQPLGISGSSGGGGAGGLGFGSPGGPGFSGGLVAAGFSSPGAPTEGSVHRRAMGSLKGASSALEALRRARERAAAAAAAAGAAGTAAVDGAAPPLAAGAADTPGGSLAAAVAAAGGAAAASGGVGVDDDPSRSYRGPVRDPGSASLWDLQFMANRLAMEGSAHGNTYTQR